MAEQQLRCGGPWEGLESCKVESAVMWTWQDEVSLGPSFGGRVCHVEVSLYPASLLAASTSG